jgi:surface polysaccharide O-acyltransferase-like enzyme
MFSQTELATSRPPGAAATTPPGQAAVASQGKRLLFLDNLRILLICGVLVVHLGATYGAVGSWMYHDPSAHDMITSTILSILDGIGMACGMGLFFLLAGYFTPRSYDRKGSAFFVRDRIIRLGIPWLVYSLLLQPLVYYIAYGLPISFRSVYSLYLQRVGSIADGPIWFVELLLIFSLVYAAWRWLTRSRPQAASGTGPMPGYVAIFGLILGLGLLSFVVRLWWPAGFQPGPFNVPMGYLTQYVIFYILGIVAYRRNWFFKLTTRMGQNWSLIALLVTLIFVGLAVPSMMQASAAAGTHQAGYAIAGGFNWLAFGYALWESFVVVGVGMGLLVLFRERWNHQGRLAKELSADVYTVYLTHPLVLVGFAYAFSVVALYPLLKWGIAVLITIPLCFLISSGIRRIPLVNQVV